MKRAAEGGPGGGPIKRGKPPRNGQFAFKVLCPEPLVASVVGTNGATVQRIQDDSSAHLTFSRRGAYYPGTKLRVLIVSGTDPSEIAVAVEQVVELVATCGDEERQGLESSGRLEEDDGDFVDASGEYRLRCALTESGATAAIGPAGHGLSALSEETGARILVDDEVFENHQLTMVSGGKEQLVAAFERLNSLVQADVEEPWFGDWADLREFSQQDEAGPEAARAARDPAPPRRPENNRGGGGGGQKGYTIFVGGLPQSTEGAALRKHFERFGKVIETDVKMDPRTGRSKGFGFVTFAETFMVERCFENTQDHVIDGKWVDVKRYGQTGGDRPAEEDGHRRYRDEPREVRRSPPRRSPPRRSPERRRPDPRGAPDVGWFVGVARSVPPEYLGFDYCISCSLPSAQCGALIGRRGENIAEVERKTGAKIQLSKKDPVSNHRELSIIGTIMSVYAAHMLLMRDFNEAMAPREEGPGPDEPPAPTRKIEDLQRQIDMLRSQVGSGGGGGSRRGPSRNAP
mmetsp:Transcript_85333/g.241849  ORF Transcript_85333/g.241849 Transcript_85333/m.241849 type:complete len:516 (-) Transcript_85333:4-1551(-)